MTMAVVVSTLLMASVLAVQAETGSVNGRSNLTRALQGAWLPLESGLAVSAREGAPLSAKYEIDDGAFQLSVYTSKTGPSSGDAFMEVIVDYSSGVVLKAETISDGGDLAAAQAQKAAMDRASREHDAQPRQRPSRRGSDTGARGRLESRHRAPGLNPGEGERRCGS